MKYLVLILMSFSLVLGCSKDNEPQNCIDEICVDGEWTWVESSGSFAGITITPESQMETRRLVITDTHYQEFLNNELILDSEYEFVKSDELSTFTSDSLILKLIPGNWFAVFGDSDMLILREPCFDCWEHIYTRE